MPDFKSPVKTTMNMVLVVFLYLIIGFAFLFLYHIGDAGCRVAFWAFFAVNFLAALATAGTRGISRARLATPMHFGVLTLAVAYLVLFLAVTLIFINQIGLAGYIFANLILVFLYLAALVPIVLVGAKK